MKRGFYRKFAVDCIRKNRRMYIPYLLTCILMVTLFYIIQALATNSNMDQVYGSEAIRYMLKIGTGLMVIFSAIFLFYTNSFLTKQRKHEFGVYNVLGLEKRHIGRILFHETLIIAAGSILSGILIGLLLYKLAFAGLMRLMGAEIPLGFEVSRDAVIRTVILFGVIQLILFLNAIRQIRFSNAIALLRGSEVGEKEPRSKWILAILGVAAILIGYGISVSITNPLAAFGLFFLAVIFVVIGTYFLFIAGSIIWLKLLRKNKTYYYKASHFINVSNMLYRMKQNAASLASICILSTMVIIAVSTTLSLYSGIDNMIQQRYPRELNVGVYTQPENHTEQYFEDTRRLFLQAAEEEGAEISNEIYATSLGIGAMQEEDTFSVDQSAGDINLNAICTLIFTDVEDYNRIGGQQVSLAPDEVLVYTNMDAPYPYDTLSVLDRTFTVKGVLEELPDARVYSANTGTNVFYVITDSMDTVWDLYERQKAVYGENASSMDYFCGFDISDTEKSEAILQNFSESFAAEQALFASENPSAGGTAFYGGADSRSGSYDSYLPLYGSMFFVGIFLSIIFLIATVLIIYYKQISEGMQDTRRYEIMQNVGLSREQIRKFIRAQVLMVFFLPLVVAGIHSAFAFPIVSRLLSVLAMGDVKSFIYCLIGTFAGFAALYIIIYSVTARTYYKIVSR